MKKLTFLLLILFSISAFNQSTPDVNTSHYGGAASDAAFDIIQNTDGDYILAGKTNSYGAGEGDMWVIKVGQNGIADPNWDFTFGGTENDQANSICQSTDGGYIIAGHTRSFASSPNTYDMWVVKISEDGIEEWSETYGEGVAASISITSDGGYIISGSKLIKTDDLGNVLWTHEMSTVSTIETSDGGYIALGGGMTGNLMLIKLDEFGGITWTNEYYGPELDFKQEVIETTDGGYMIAATTSSYGAGELDAWLIKTDNLGNKLWSETYGDIYHDECHGITQTPDGGYIFTGIRQVNYIYNNDVWVVKIDAQGTIQWDWSVDLAESNWGEKIIVNEQGGYVAAGMTNTDTYGVNDMYMMIFDADALAPWFTASPTIVLDGEYVQFSDGSLGTATSWVWDFGNEDPPFNGQTPPPVQYNGTGSYDVTLTIDGGLTFTRTDYIEVVEQLSLLYCESWGVHFNNWIKAVGVNGQVNNSIDFGYENFTNIIFTLQEASTNDISLDPGANPGKKIPKWWRVWIDFDMDGDFEGDEVFSANNEKGGVTGTFAVPEGFYGETRMRVSMSADGIPSPCDKGSFSGEVEDYTISVLPPTPQPPVADFEADANNVGTFEMVTFNDLSLDDPIYWEWTFTPNTVNYLEGTTQFSQDPKVEFTNTGSYTVSLFVSNDYGNDTETKENFIIVSDDPPAFQYCEPINITNSSYYHLKEVYVGDYSNTGYYPGGYTLQSDLGTWNLTLGEDYNILLVPSNNRSRNFWRLWIDLNGNGDFEDDGDPIFTANNKKGDVSGIISIPSDASADGVTRMRIMMKNKSAPSWSCEDDFDGEVQDFNVEFIQGLKDMSISGNEDSHSVSIFPNPISGDNLKLELGAAFSATDIRIYNKLGFEMDHYTIVAGSHYFNISHYPPGMYFILIDCDLERIVKKFIKR